MVKWKIERKYTGKHQAFKIYLHFYVAVIGLWCRYFIFLSSFIFAHTFHTTIYLVAYAEDPLSLLLLLLLQFLHCISLFSLNFLINLLCLFGIFDDSTFPFGTNFISSINGSFWISFSPSENCPNMECDLQIQIYWKEKNIYFGIKQLDYENTVLRWRTAAFFHFRSRNTLTNLGSRRVFQF